MRFATTASPSEKSCQRRLRRLTDTGALVLVATSLPSTALASAGLSGLPHARDALLPAFIMAFCAMAALFAIARERSTAIGRLDSGSSDSPDAALVPSNLPDGATAQILASSTDGIVVVDSKLTIIAINHLALQMAGAQDVRSFLEKPLGVDVLKALAQAIRHGAALQRGVDADPQKPLQGRSRPAFTARATPVASGGAVAIIEDHRQILAIEERHRECTADVAHDLRAPLTAVQGYAEAILDNPAEEPESRARHLRLILDECARMSSLVTDILDLTSLASGRVEIAFQPLDVSEVVKETIQLFQKSASERSIALRTHIEAEASWAQGDASRIRQALRNLVSNAVAYSPTGSEVAVCVARQTDYIALSVHDEGPGLSADELERVWQRYYRVKSQQSPSSGTGLGLAIVRRIAELHGGKAGAESTPGGGSTFWFTVPRNR